MNLRSYLCSLAPAFFLVAVQSMAAPGVTAQDADYAPDLLSPLSGLTDPMAQKGIIRSQSVTVDVRLLDRVAAQDVLRVELFKNTVFRARFVWRERVGPVGYVWHGTLEGHPQSSFIISVVGSCVSASFSTFKKPGALTLEWAPGRHIAREVQIRRGAVKAIAVPAAAGSRESACDDHPDRIDVLIVYDTLALFQAFGNTAALKGKLNGRLAYANAVMKNSLLNMRFSVTSYMPVNYRTGNMVTDLYYVTYKKGSTRDPNGVMDTVLARRTSENADLVAMFVGDDVFAHGLTQGLAWTPVKGSGYNQFFGFSVTVEGLLIGNNVFTQEICHNFGCQHDPANITNPSSLIKPYARAYKYGFVGFVTNTGYPDLTHPVIGYLSTPSITYKIPPFGPTVPIGVKDLNDNRRQVLEARQAIANYRRANTGPVITSHPATASRCQGYQANPVIMSIKATGARRYTTRYQWYRNNKAVAGQAGTQLRLTTITPADAGSYHCAAINNCGTVISNKASLTVSNTCNTRRFVGATGTRFGLSVSRAGDFNRDGYEDFVIGEPFASAKGRATGAVHVRSGKDSSVLLSLNYAAGEEFGYSVAPAGDVDQDGYADIIVGARGWGSRRGYARVISGKTRAQKYIFFGDTGRGDFGTSVSGAGDIDGDGHPDLIVGAPGKDMVRLFSGRTGGVIRTLNGLPGERFGQSVGPAGDIDQDGYDDVIVGVPNWSGGRGYARVFSGRDGKILHTVTGTTASGQLGQSVAGIGDVNLDGFPDFAVGSPEAAAKGSRSGLVQVFSGKDKRVLHSISYASNERLGYSVAAAGDVDGDGRPDFHVGAPGWSNNRGYARTISGRTGAPIAISFGVASDGQRGFSVSGFEANGDAKPDLLVSEPYASTVWLLDGPLAANPPEIEIYGAACSSSRGTLPHVAFGGRASIGKVFEPKVYAGTRSVTTWFMLDAVRSALPLAFLGAPGCTGYALPALTLGTSTDANGRAGFKLPVPNQASLIGAQVHTQWVLFDATANGAGLITTNAARVKLGRQ